MNIYEIQINDEVPIRVGLGKDQFGSLAIIIDETKWEDGSGEIPGISAGGMIRTGSKERLHIDWFRCDLRVNDTVRIGLKGEGGISPYESRSEVSKRIDDEQTEAEFQRYLELKKKYENFRSSRSESDA